MFEAGEDPLFIARRFVRIAGEDIGLADPTALNLAVSTMQGDFQSCALFWKYFSIQISKISDRQTVVKCL